MYQTTARAFAHLGWQVSVGGIYKDVSTVTATDDQGVQVWRLLKPFAQRILSPEYVSRSLTVGAMGSEHFAAKVLL